MSSRARQAKTRRAKELEAGFGVTLLTGVIVVFSLMGSGPAKSPNLPLVLGSGALAVAVWAWAIWTIRARNAAGKTIEQIQALTSDQFEEWVGARLHDLGYAVKVTGKGGDHGVDLLVEKKGELAVVQCKNYRVYSVGEPILRDLYGAMHDYGAKQAYLATTGYLTKPARDWVEGKPITVWDGDKLVELSQQLARKSQSTLAPAPPTQSPEATASAVANDPDTIPPPSQRVCPKCGSALVVRQNRRTGQSFLGCPSYPACRHAEPLPA